MSDYYVGEIRIFPYNRIPKGWMACEGQTLPVMQNQALFSLIGPVYGGDGRTTFKLPDLRGRVPVGIAPNMVLGAAGGTETHALTVSEMPQHTHSVAASTDGGSVPSPAANAWAKMLKAYGTTTDVQMSPGAISVAGASQPHPNMQPYLTLCLCIATTGIYPTRP